VVEGLLSPRLLPHSHHPLLVRWCHALTLVGARHLRSTFCHEECWETCRPRPSRGQCYQVEEAQRSSSHRRRRRCPRAPPAQRRHCHRQSQGCKVHRQSSERQAVHELTGEQNSSRTRQHECQQSGERTVCGVHCHRRRVPDLIRTAWPRASVPRATTTRKTASILEAKTVPAETSTAAGITQRLPEKGALAEGASAR